MIKPRFWHTVDVLNKVVMVLLTELNVGLLVLKITHIHTQCFRLRNDSHWGCAGAETLLNMNWFQYLHPTPEQSSEGSFSLHRLVEQLWWCWWILSEIPYYADFIIAASDPCLVLWVCWRKLLLLVLFLTSLLCKIVSSELFRCSLPVSLSLCLHVNRNIFSHIIPSVVHINCRLSLSCCLFVLSQPWRY